MSAVLPAPDAPVVSVAGAIARMEAIGAALPAADGLACFNRMYLDVTRQVNSRHLAAVSTLVANWTINSARDLAWKNCMLLWAVRDNPLARGLFLDALAASTALASQLLLVPV